MGVGRFLGILVFIFFLLLFSEILSVLILGSGTSTKEQGIAIIKINKPIYFSSQPGFLSSSSGINTILQLIKRAEEDKRIKGVLFEINSPGGSPVATEEIVRAIEKLKRKKPAVAWIADVGASGAYWIASSCNKTYADALSITGSIGVYSASTDLSRLYDWLGINITIIKSGKYKDMGSSSRGLTDEEKKILQNVVNITHNHFIKSVAKNRGLDIDYVRKLATGRIYIGEEAKKLRLIDDTLGREEAIAQTGIISGLGPQPQIIDIRPEPNISELLRSLTQAFGQGVGQGVTYTLKSLHYKGLLSLG